METNITEIKSETDSKKDKQEEQLKSIFTQLVQQQDSDNNDKISVEIKYPKVEITRPSKEEIQ